MKVSRTFAREYRKSFISDSRISIQKVVLYMIIINIFGEISRTVISEKLGITLSNLSSDWQEEMVEVLEEEIYLRKFTVIKYNKDFSNGILEYDVQEIINHKNFREIFNTQQTELECLEEISRNLLRIEVEDFENSMLRKKNNYMDSPTCEIEYGEKWIKLFDFVTRYNVNGGTQKWLSLFSVYSSERSLFENTRIFMAIRAEMSRTLDVNSLYFNQEKIKNLVEFGELIDDFLKSDKDFYKLDYIMTALADDNNYNAYHLFKNYSLIEMIIGDKSKNRTTNIDKYLQGYLISERFKSEIQKKTFSKLIRQIRNKIAHGDFIGVKKKLEEYSTEFMENYHFDYYEYSRENWIYLNICCELDEILSKIIWDLIIGRLPSKKKLKRKPQLPKKISVYKN